MPARLASASIFDVTAGGVMIDNAVSEAASSRALVEDNAGRGSSPEDGEKVIEELDGLRGVTGKPCWRYQTRTEKT